MKPTLKLPLLFGAAIAMLVSCKNEDKKKDDQSKEPAMKEQKLKEENITYTVGGDADTVKLDGYVVYDENFEGKRPAVLVVHEWWGLNDYPKMRARELAKLGYIAMALDMYGNGRRAEDPAEAGKLSASIYTNPQLAGARFEAAFRTLKAYPQADTTKTAAIGYCFGGAVVLSMAKSGEDIKGVISFHGSLNDVTPQKGLLKAQVLVCHGADDPFVPQKDVDLFKKQMDSVGAQYNFKAYSGAVHAFTNPNATAIGEKFKIPIRYNAAADTASWNDMKDFFNQLFK